MAATTITRATITDDSGGGTDGSVLNSAFFGTAIYDKVDALFTASTPTWESSQASGLELKVYNTANSASAYSRVQVAVGGASALDPYTIYNVAGVNSWSVGIDNSDGDALKIAPAVGLGTGDALTISTSRNIVPGTAALATNATDGFTYVQSCAGAPSGTPTSYTGRVPEIVDTTNLRKYYYIAGTWRYVGLT